MPPDWKRLQELASEETARALKSLPPQVREEAAALPITFEPWPGDALVDDGIEPDILGLFVGADRNEEGHFPMPPGIILFLQNIWDMVEDEGGGEKEFRREVRTTLLHELGHYLGLDEDDLFERGLE